MLSAFPGWLPEDQRDDAMIGLSLASAGLIWLLLYVVPLFIAAADRTLTAWRVSAILIGLAAMVLGGVVALPLPTGADDTPPVLTVTCPRAPVIVGEPAVALVAASDADSALVNPPAAEKELDTSRVGVFPVTETVEDEFGHATTAACAFRVAPDA